VDAWDGADWQHIASATSIGNMRLLQTKTTTASKVRLRITAAAACPAISEFALFQMPEMPTPNTT
jgi:alpha-L-fucosidase